jgi:putative transposase
MRREVHVRFCERLGVRLPGPTLLIILNQRHLRRLLKSYLMYYHRSRTHLALAKDAPEPRAIMRQGAIIAIPQVGGLHHRYERRAA